MGSRGPAGGGERERDSLGRRAGSGMPGGRGRKERLLPGAGRERRGEFAARKARVGLCQSGEGRRKGRKRDRDCCWAPPTMPREAAAAPPRPGRRCLCPRRRRRDQGQEAETPPRPPLLPPVPQETPRWRLQAGVKWRRFPLSSSLRPPPVFRSFLPLPGRGLPTPRRLHKMDAAVGLARRGARPTDQPARPPAFPPVEVASTLT